MATHRQVQHQPPHAATRAEAASQARRYPSFDELPDSAMVRQSQLVYNPRRPGVPVPLPFGASSLWRKVADGSFPAPIKLSSRTTVWKVSAVRSWIAAQQEGGQ